MTVFQDHLILERLLDSIEQLQQRDGRKAPTRQSASSSRKLRAELATYADLCRRGELKGRARKRKSGELFRRIISLAPEVWV